MSAIGIRNEAGDWPDPVAVADARVNVINGSGREEHKVIHGHTGIRIVTLTLSGEEA